MKIWIGIIIPLFVSSVHAAEIEQISLPLIPDLQRTDLYMLKMSEQATGLLVLCPGCNGNGREWIKDPVWQRFARNHKLDLVALSFASDTSLLTQGRGYYYASEGSGQLLLDGISKVYHQQLPLILYGFSGGAHFVSRFAEWKPDRVKTWCAYSAGWWDEPIKGVASPPGLVMCGEDDDRYGASLLFYEQGRALGKPWLWLSAPRSGHSIYAPAEDFVRKYFAAILDTGLSNPTGEWVDIDHKTPVSLDAVNNQPSITGWLPDTKLLADWQAVHTP
jgi:pimeloyl-ACP methyl ester carboxylesterase